MPKKQKMFGSIKEVKAPGVPIFKAGKPEKMIVQKASKVIAPPNLKAAKLKTPKDLKIAKPEKLKKYVG